jgi:hypothetical protein
MLIVQVAVHVKPEAVAAFPAATRDNARHSFPDDAGWELAR